MFRHKLLTLLER